MVGVAIMVVCCLPGCSNVFVKGRKSLKFFRFPSDQELRQKWLNELCLDSVSPNARICSRHFPVGTKSQVGVIPTISKSHHVKKKAAVSASSIKRSRVKVTATWFPPEHFSSPKSGSPTNMSSGQKSFRRKASTPKKLSKACRRSLNGTIPVRKEEQVEDENFEDDLRRRLGGLPGRYVE